MEDPTCVFSGMTWQGSSIEGLGYFIEGDEKGDFVSVFLPNGWRSRKYAYYGQPPLVFYREMEVEEEDDKAPPNKPPTPEKDDKPEKPKKKKIVYIPITSCDFRQFQLTSVYLGTFWLVPVDFELFLAISDDFG